MTAVLALVLMAQAVPVPLGPIKRAPYVETLPSWPAAWKPLVRPATLRYAPLPGWIACSLDPTGLEVCGPGVWLNERD